MITDYEFNNMMERAKLDNNPKAMMEVFALMEKQKNIAAKEAAAFPQYSAPEPHKLSWEQDEHRNKKSVTINVQIMVENLLGGPNPNRDIQVRLEKYGDKFYSNGSEGDGLAFVVVNICDLKTASIITLRETYIKFPSPEFLTKLELLRVGDAVS